MYSLRHISRLIRDIRMYNLSVPRDFFAHTPQWIKRHYNGIGAEWMPERWRRFLSRCFAKLEPVALVHDIEYLKQKKSYWHFTKANLRFWLNASKRKRFFIGGACALICQLFGWSAYRDGKESMAYYYFYKESK